MPTFVICSDSLLRETLAAFLAANGLTVSAAAARMAEIVPGHNLAAADEAVIVAVADSMDTSDWELLSRLKSNSLGEGPYIALVSSMEYTGLKIADAVIDRRQGARGLLSALQRFSSPSPTTPGAPKVFEQSPPRHFNHHAASPLHDYTPSIPRRLTQRETEVANLVAQGMPNRRIAAVLQLQEQSIKNLVSAVMRKLDCENRVQVALRLSKPVSAHRLY